MLIPRIAACATLSLLSALQSPQDATTFALIYGLPLLSYSGLASNTQKVLGGFIANTFYHQTNVIDPSFNDIVRPNVDTLRSVALIDLASNDVIVNIPEIPNRFFVLPFYDSFGNNIANIGPAGFSNSPGSYLLSYRPARPGFELGDNDKYAGNINLPTPYGAILLRIAVNSSDTSDVQTVTDFQKNFTLTVGPNRTQAAPVLTAALLFDGLPDDRNEKILALTARLSPYNLPEVASDIQPVFAALQIAGLSRGSYSTPPGVDLNLAGENARGNISFVDLGDFDTNFVDLGNSWSAVRGDFAGDFGTHYTLRAFIAAQAYLQLKADQAIYPIFNISGNLNSTSSFNVTFSGKPPVTGFWSLTVYNETGNLIDNQWNISSLGDRSSIQYSDGSLVYGSNGNGTSDGDGGGAFSIILQSLTTPPPDQYLSNWIPTPALNATNTGFTFNLRWYGPTKALVDGNYTYPVVRAIAILS